MVVDPVEEGPVEDRVVDRVVDPVVDPGPLRLRAGHP